jgi:fido (protein-threonine AMPylation protein)
MVIERRKTRGRPSLDDVLAVLDEEVDLLHSNLGGLPRAVEADHILREIWIDDVHNSTAIEGNTMTRAQVEQLIERRRVSADLIETLEVEAYARAADWVYREAARYEGVPSDVLSEIHRQALGLVWEVDPPPTRDRAGSWRKGGVRVRGVRVIEPVAITAELSEWSASTRSAQSHPVIHSALHHAWLERIHPFTDGNGRVGRLVLNLMLIQNGYPPAVILAEQRNRYLQALRATDRGNPSPLAGLVARAVRGTLSRFLIPKLAGEAKLIPLSALAHQGPYSPAYLRQLVINGRLRAVREGRLYLSSRAWLNQYIADRDPRGGQPGSRRKESDC